MFYISSSISPTHYLEIIDFTYNKLLNQFGTGDKELIFPWKPSIYEP